MKKKNFVLSAIVSLVLITNILLAQGNKLRVISLAPATTEILFALGLDKEIVGVSLFCNYPASAKTKEKVGTFSNPDVEKILSLKPDIIFCTGLEQAPVITKLRQLKLNVCVSDPKTINELFISIHEIAGFIGKQREAALLVGKINSDINKIKSKLSNMNKSEKPKVFIQIWDDPIVTAGRGSFVDELITICGAENISFDTKKPYSYFSAEEIIKRNPDCIIFTYMVQDKSIDSVSKRPSYKNLSAVKNNKVFNDINPDIILRPGPRVAQGLDEIFKRIYQ